MKNMEIKRYNIFNKIHKALRLMLYDTATTIQRTNFADIGETVPLLVQLEKVLYSFDSHADHEDTFILPHIILHNSSIVDELEQDHGDDHSMVQNLLHLISKWKKSRDEDSRIMVGLEIHYLFNEFVAFNLYHMNKEEKALNQVLWDNYTDQEIIQIERTLLSHIPPEDLTAESRWMMRAINNSEILDWLTSIKTGAPEEVYKGFLKMGETELPSTRWKEIETAFGIETVSFN
jgi:hypothetical protein